MTLTEKKSHGAKGLFLYAMALFILRLRFLNIQASPVIDSVVIQFDNAVKRLSLFIEQIVRDPIPRGPKVPHHDVQAVLLWSNGSPK